MWKCFHSVALSLLLVGFCHADDALKEAEKLLELSGTKQAMDQVADMMLAQELQNNPTLVPFESVMRQFFFKYLSYESTKDELAKLYTTEFTKEELVAINEFYSTEVGQKSVKAMPGLMQQAGDLAMRRVQDNIHELQEMIAKEAERLKHLSEQ